MGLIDSGATGPAQSHWSQGSWDSAGSLLPWKPASARMDLEPWFTGAAWSYQSRLRPGWAGSLCLLISQQPSGAMGSTGGQPGAWIHGSPYGE